jgi:cytochrome c1
MPPPLSDGKVNYVDGTKEHARPESRDVVEFLAWASEPHLEARNRTGVPRDPVPAGLRRPDVRA